VDDPNTNRSFYLPRLPRVFYQSDSVTFWSMPVSHREQGWLSDRFHSAFRELVLHAAARERLFCPTYCLMPDHLHLILMGLHPDSTQSHSFALS